MVRRSKGIRSNTRKKFKKDHRARGMTTITRTLQNFDVGEKANIVIDPSVHGGQPHHRFHGFCGTVVGTQGDVFKVSVKDGRKDKVLLIAAEHLRKVS